MKIASLETRSYTMPLEPPFEAAWDPVPRTSVSDTLVILGTDEGHTGIAGGAQVPDLDLLRNLLLGTDLDPEAIHRTLATVDFHGGRNWTVEVAAWDALAKAEGLPLWKYLGGTTDRFRAYQSTGARVPTAERVERTLAAQAEGFSAAKIRINGAPLNEDLECLALIRKAVGNDFALLVDANQGWRMPGDLRPPWNLSQARECARALADLGIYWLEEPLDTSDVDSYKTLRDDGLVRIAAGEMVRTTAESKRLLAGVDVIQNDVVLSGGIAGCRAIAEEAKSSDVIWSPHTWSTGMGLLANLHGALAFSTGEYLELPYDPPFWTARARDFVLPEPVRIESGWLVAPPGPGLGVDIDLDAIERWRSR